MIYQWSITCCATDNDHLFKVLVATMLEAMYVGLHAGVCMFGPLTKKKALRICGTVSGPRLRDQSINLTATGCATDGPVYFAFRG